MKAIDMPQGINIERVRLTDRRQIEDIEQSSGIEPWTDDDWNRETRSSNSGWLVARDGFWSMCPVAGYVLFHLKHEFAEIRRLVVRREYRRKGIAERLIARAEQSIVLASATMAEVGQPPIREVIAEVPESMVAMQCALRASRFKCVATTHGFDGDVYLFKKQLKVET